MAVPDNFNFTFKDVCQEVYGDTNPGRDLSQAFLDAAPNYFDPDYEGNHDRLTNFRNYHFPWEKRGDWHLPSMGELIEMYNVLWDDPEPLGNFLSQFYWSSSEYQAVNAWAKSFNDGTEGVTGKTQTAVAIRPSRKVNFPIGENPWSLRERGVTGGWIYHIGIYYNRSYAFEAAEFDIPENLWSNIHDALAGTDTAINSGSLNTSYIRNQDGHTHSAALDCFDYVSG